MIWADARWGEILGGVTGILAVTFIFGGWVIHGVAKSFAENHRKKREAEQLAVLKQSMIERGFSADEIERVIRAGIAADFEPSVPEKTV
jgi:hypothetical protein